MRPHIPQILRGASIDMEIRPSAHNPQHAEDESSRSIVPVVALHCAPGLVDGGVFEEASAHFDRRHPVDVGDAEAVGTVDLGAAEGIEDAGGALKGEEGGEVEVGGDFEFELVGEGE